MNKVILIFMASILSSCTPHTNKIVQKNIEVNQTNTAIIAIEFQKTWTEKGFFYKMIRKELQKNDVIKNTRELLEIARTNNFTVIHAPLILDKTDRENYKKIPLIPKLFKGFTKDTWKAEYTEGIFKETDIEVTGRCGFDACEGSDLEEILKLKAIKNLLFCGFTTEHCVEMTMNTLREKGYNCILIKDCTATKSQGLQKNVEARNQIIKSEELIEKIKTSSIGD